ncbi:MAG: glycine cleavage T C-terminal barrel domain-containing protein, partial [Albidovulum sp.]
WLALRKAGEAHGLKLFGARAVDSMRMEMGFLHWKADLLTEFTPFETGLHRFVKLEKGDFIGKAALTKLHAAGERKAFVSLKVHATHAPARGGASLMAGDKVVGTISSADWGHRVGMNLAYAFIDPALSAVGTRLHLDMYGDMVAVEVIAPSPYDPDFRRIRG